MQIHKKNLKIHANKSRKVPKIRILCNFVRGGYTNHFSRFYQLSRKSESCIYLGNMIFSWHFSRHVLGFFTKINAPEGCIFQSVGYNEGGSILSAPAKSFLKISELESEFLGFMWKIYTVCLWKLNFHVAKVALSHSNSCPFERQKWHFWKQFSPFFEEKYARFA